MLTKSNVNKKLKKKKKEELEVKPGTVGSAPSSGNS